MPKANGKDAFYFPHDCNARNDNKILAMRSEYGSEGYGLYWMIIEVLREQPDYKYPLGKFAFKSLAMDLHCDSARLEEFILNCCEEFKDDNSSLLQMDENYLWSDSLLRRMELVDALSSVRQEAALKRWKKKGKSSSKVGSDYNPVIEKTASDYNPVIGDLNQLESICDGDSNQFESGSNRCGSTADANALQLQSKREEKKEKEKREKESKEEQNQNGAGAVAAAEERIFSLLFEAYREQTGKLAGESQKRQLKEYADQLGAAVVLEAFRVSKERNVVNWSYTKRILQDWVELGIDSIEKVQAEQEKWKRGNSPAARGVAGVPSFDTPQYAENIKRDLDRMDRLFQGTEEDKQ